MGIVEYAKSAAKEVHKRREFHGSVTEAEYYVGTIQGYLAKAAKRIAKKGNHEYVQIQGILEDAEKDLKEMKTPNTDDKQS
jgi:hypothetical protein